jgi:hypothetical protein
VVSINLPSVSGHHMRDSLVSISCCCAVLFFFFFELPNSSKYMKAFLCHFQRSISPNAHRRASD